MAFYLPILTALLIGAWTWAPASSASRSRSRRSSSSSTSRCATGRLVSQARVVQERRGAPPVGARAHAPRRRPRGAGARRRPRSARSSSASRSRGRSPSTRACARRRCATCSRPSSSSSSDCRTDPRDLVPMLDPGRRSSPSSTMATKVLTGYIAARRAGIGEAGRWRAGFVLTPRGEFSIVIAGLAVGSGIDRSLGALATAYVLITIIAGPILARSPRRAGSRAGPEAHPGRPPPARRPRTRRPDAGAARQEKLSRVDSR